MYPFIRRTVFLLLVLSATAVFLTGTVRYLRWQKVQPLIARLTAAGDKLPPFANTNDWDAWLYTRDMQIRSQAERNVEDAISGFILFGTTFTSLPRLARTKDATNVAGDLTPAAKARIDDFIKALDERDDERFRVAFEFLKRQRVVEEELPAFLGGIVRRLALDHSGDEHLHAYATSELLTVNFAIEEALKGLKARGAAPSHTRRIAIISSGLDFGGTAQNYDFYQPQTITPFAILETVLRLSLAQSGEAQVVVFELSPFAVSNLRTTTVKARAGSAPVLQLPRHTADAWNPQAVAYWSHFGELIGTGATALVIPNELHELEIRAVSIKAQVAARIAAEDMNVVTQTEEPTQAPSFDLVVALNAFERYDGIEQSLALESISEMMNSGAVFLADANVPAIAPQELESLGVQHIRFSDRGTAHDIAAYRRK